MAVSPALKQKLGVEYVFHNGGSGKRATFIYNYEARLIAERLGLGKVGEAESVAVTLYALLKPENPGIEFSEIPEILDDEMQAGNMEKLTTAMVEAVKKSEPPKKKDPQPAAAEGQ